MALVGAMYQDDIWFTFWWSTMARVEVEVFWDEVWRTAGELRGASRWSSRTAPRDFTIGDLATHLTGPCVFYYIHWLPCGVPNLLHNNSIQCLPSSLPWEFYSCYDVLIFVLWTQCPPTPLQLDCINFCKYFTLKLTAMDPLKVLNTSSIPLLLLWYLYL